MIILGIDPGTTRIGFGVITVSGSKIKALEYGIISNPGKDRAHDLMSTVDSLNDILKRYRPQGGYRKIVFHHKPDNWNGGQRNEGRHTSNLGAKLN